MGIKKLIKEKILMPIRGEIPLAEYQKRGMQVGSNFSYQNGCTFDVSHCWLISIGKDVTFSARVHLLVHDASTQKISGYVKIGRIIIGDRVFVGADTIILPNVTIGNDSIIGAGSVVSSNVPEGEVWGGTPAHYICNMDVFRKKYAENSNLVKLDETYTYRGGITKEKKQMMREILERDGLALVK